MTAKDFHLVRPGDTLIGIAAEHALAYLALADWNEIPRERMDLIYVGQRLRLTPPTSSDSRDRAPGSAGSGRYCSPVDARSNLFCPPGWMVTLGFTQRYPNHPAYGPMANRHHSGVDLVYAWGETLGKPLYAIGDGLVIHAGEAHYGWGNVIEISLDGVAEEARYGHVLHCYVNVGDRVRKGQVVASIGSSGGRYQPHLHFDVGLRDVLEADTAVRSYFVSPAKVRQNFRDPVAFIQGKTT